METELVGIREFARRVGVSHSAVQKAISSGRISIITDENKKVLIDSTTAFQQWNLNRDESKIRKFNQPENSQQSDSTLSESENSQEIVVEKLVQEKEKEVSEGKEVIREFYESKKLREHYLAERERLQLLKEQGKVEDMDKIGRALKDFAINYKRVIEKIPIAIMQKLEMNLTPEQIEIFGRIIQETTYNEYRTMRENYRLSYEIKKKNLENSTKN